MIAIMYSDDAIYQECKKELIKLFDDIFKEGTPYDFDQFTSYYEKEMGKGIVKRFLIFKKQTNKQDLKEIKLKTTEIEKKHSKDDKRTINLDPGYISENELVLASFKKGSNYKEDLGDGIYAHKVLEFKDNKAIELWHTFPDYREKENQEFFIENKLL